MCSLGILCSFHLSFYQTSYTLGATHASFGQTSSSQCFVDLRHSVESFKAWIFVYGGETLDTGKNVQKHETA